MGTPSNIDEYTLKRLCAENGAFVCLVTIILLIHLTKQEVTRSNLELRKKEKQPFRVEDTYLVKPYTGFPSYELFVAFYKFFGPPVDHLNYWETKCTPTTRQKKVGPFNCFLLTLMKLRLDLQEKDFGCRFGISAAFVCRYFNNLGMFHVPLPQGN